MKTTSLIVPVGILALFLNGCPSSNAPSEQAVQPSPSPSPQVIGTPPTFDKTLESKRATTTTQKITGLIPSTNPEQHQETVKQGRNDPFAMIPVEPIVKFPPPKQTINRAPRQVGTSVARPSGPPQPNEALGVVVSGVMDLPSSPVAIVKAPGESVVRRVTPGATLSNGQVRVKAIYAENGDSMVILEQDGVEVIKRVGEGVVESPKTI